MPSGGYTSTTNRVRLALVGAIAVCVLALLVDLAQPPHVLLVGDSITGQYGPTAAAALRRHGYHTNVRAYPGMGLLDRGPRIDAPDALRADLAVDHWRVVVAEFSGNYGIVDAPLPGVAVGSGAFLAAWQAEVAAFTRQATSDGASLVWLVAPPPIRGDATVSDHLATLYRAQQRGGVSVLDPSPAVSLLDRNGDLYAPDGRHLSANGVKVIAQLVARRVEAHSRWRLRFDEMVRSPLAFTLAVLALACVVGVVTLGRRARPLRGRRSHTPRTA